ncbi:MAG: hypothetical protein M1826_004290 [Phylliscum demangeonii]|nr:MAG: hypothetical protein M1826_004290 [Phylliscum demangeonii]
MRLAVAALLLLPASRQQLCQHPLQQFQRLRQQCPQPHPPLLRSLPLLPHQHQHQHPHRPPHQHHQRQQRHPGGGAPPIAAPTVTQMPSVVVAGVPSVLPNGVITQIQITFTQTFASVPDPFPTPASGAIGMGSLTGTVGAVRTNQVKAKSVAAHTFALALDGRWGVGLGSLFVVGAGMALWA